MEKLSKTQLLALLLEQEIAQRATPEEMYTAFGHRLGYLDKESFYKAAIKCWGIRFDQELHCLSLNQ